MSREPDENDPASLAELRLLRESLRHVRDSIIITRAAPLDDPGPEIVYVNEAVETMSGFSAAEVLGKTPRLFQGPGTSRQTLDEIKEALKKGEPIRREVLNYTKSGREHWVEMDINPIGRNGAVEYFVSIRRDITSWKKAQEDLAFNASLLDKAHEAIVVLSADGVIELWNKGAEGIFGWSRAEALGRRMNELLGSDGEGWSAAIASVLDSGNWGGSLEHQNKAGATITTKSSWTLINGKENDHKRILTINSDITQARALEQQVIRAQRAESIGRLAGGIAHDLNNMLAPILLSVDTLRNASDDRVRDQVLNLIEASTQRAADLVRQVLSLSRNAGGEWSDVDVRHVIREISTIVKETFPRNISLKLAMPDDLWNIAGQSTRIHQVLMNICVNARDAMPDGGTLTIEAGNEELDQNYARMNPEATSGPHVWFAVTDTGCGMDQALINKIFDPFFTTKETGRGSGLGLSTTLAIVKAHHGFIQVSSRPKAGSSFKVYLPARPSGTAAGAEVTTKPVVPRGNGETVLMVDDEEFILNIATSILEGHGYRTLRARNGAEAAGIYARHMNEIDIVITDMAMPIMDGHALIIALRAMNDQVKIVASSGQTSEGGIGRVMAAGIQHYIPKPYTAAILLGTVTQALKD